MKKKIIAGLGVALAGTLLTACAAQPDSSDTAPPTVSFSTEGTVHVHLEEGQYALLHTIMGAQRYAEPGSTLDWPADIIRGIEVKEMGTKRVIYQLEIPVSPGWPEDDAG